MNNQFEALDVLKEKFKFLTFMTDIEIMNFLSLIQSVAFGTSVSPDVIRKQIEFQSRKNLAYC